MRVLSKGRQEENRSFNVSVEKKIKILVTDSKTGGD